MAPHSTGIHHPATTLEPGELAGEATFSGGLTTLFVDGDVIVPMLPSLTVPAQPSSRYQVLLAFGEQARGMTYFGGWPIPWGVRYHELMVAIPFVRLEGRDEVYLFVAGMTCDFPPAVWNGNQFYGFKKRFVAMSSGPDRFVVDPSEEGFSGTLRPSPAIDEDREWLRWASSLPVLGIRDDGSFVRTRFDWSFTNARLEAAQVQVHIGRQFPEFAAGTYQGSGVRVTGMRWRLGWPQPL
jgi:hypothetical protein